MRHFRNMSRVDKAKLLHKLFPDDVIAFIVFEKFAATAFQRDKETHRKNWREDDRFQFDFWLSIVDDAVKRIQRHELDLTKKSDLFADQLFEGYTYYFTLYCLEIFIESNKCTNDKMREAIKFLFK
jgi:hypothetical protein